MWYPDDALRLSATHFQWYEHVQSRPSFSELLRESLSVTSQPAAWWVTVKISEWASRRLMHCSCHFCRLLVWTIDLNVRVDLPFSPSSWQLHTTRSANRYISDDVSIVSRLNVKKFQYYPNRNNKKKQTFQQSSKHHKSRKDRFGLLGMNGWLIYATTCTWVRCFYDADIGHLSICDVWCSPRLMYLFPQVVISCKVYLKATDAATANNTKALSAP